MPDRNSYDFRLVVSRKMYDGSVAVQHAASLAQLAQARDDPPPPARPRSARRDAAAREVKVSSQRGTVVLAAEADADVLRGTAWVPFNQAGANIGDLIDCTAPVTDVRIETL